MNDNPTKGKCVHTVVIDNWKPDLCAVTLPNLERFAKRIGADFNVISKAKFDGYPPNYERLQIWEDGKDYAWNINVDADTILHRDFEDPTSWLDSRYVASSWMTDPRFYFVCNKYFERDGRLIGIADSFVVSSYATHDLWRPLDIPFSEARKLCLKDERMVSEYCLSLNVARYGLKFNGAIKDKDKFYSIGTTTNKVADPVKMMINKLKEWGELM